MECTPSHACSVHSGKFVAAEYLSLKACCCLLMRPLNGKYRKFIDGFHNFTSWTSKGN